MEDIVRTLLEQLGEDPKREGLLKTPQRVAEAWKFLTKGYDQSPEEVINGAMFSENTRDMVLVKDIDFFSVCEHHLLPFYGRCHLAYIPNGKIIGLSKLARIVEIYARRLQVQERLTSQIADTMNQCLKPHGVAVVLEARHLCMMMRGVERQRSTAVTSSMLGTFHENPASRQEFLELSRSSLGQL